jgi:nucleoprotein TPR
VAEARAQAEASLAQAQSLGSQVEGLRGELAARTAQLEGSLARVKGLREEQAEARLAFAEEMDATARLAALHREASEEAMRRVGELEGQLAALQEQCGSVDERLAEMAEGRARAEAEYERLLEEKEQALRSMRDAFGVAEGGLGEVSPSAEAARRLLPGPQSFGQVFADLARCRAELLAARQEADRLRGCLRDVCEDIEARLPQIQQDRLENGQLRGDLAGLSERLLEVAQARDALAGQWARAQEELGALRRERAALEQQVKDLGQQLQGLLCSQAAADTTEEGGGGGGAVIDSDQVITQRLVAFRSVAELQQRNQELLRVVRDLGARAEAKEEERLRAGDAALQARLEEAMRELEELREARTRQAGLVQSIVRQRDMLKDLLLSQQQQPVMSAVDGCDKEAETEKEAKAKAKEEAEEAFREERERSEAFLAERLEEARREASQSRMELAKSQARAEFGEERQALLQASWDAQRAELEALRRANGDATGKLVQLQGQLQGLLSDLMAARERAGRAEASLALSKAELGVAKEAERRLVAEREALLAEKGRLAGLLGSLQAMASEAEASSAMLRERLADQVQALEGQLQAARRKLEEQAEEARLQAAALRREHGELTRRYAELAASAQARQEESSRAQALLAAKLTDLEGRLSTAHGEEASEPEREARALRMRIGLLEDRLRLAQEQAEQFRALALATEGSLAELGQTYALYREATERALGEREQAAERATRELAEAREAMLALERASAAWAAEREGLEARLGPLGELEALLRSHADLRVEDLGRLQGSLEEARALHAAEQAAHERDLEAMRALSERLGALEAALRRTQEALQAAQLEAAVKETQGRGQMEALQAEKASLATRLAELDANYGVLLDQLQHRQQQLQQQEPDGGDEGGSVVIGYLRRQREVLQEEHQSLQLDHRRLQAQLGQTQALLDEARGQLAEAREAGQWQSQMAQEYAALQGKLDQLGQLREANEALRHQAEGLARKLGEAEARAHALQEESDAARGRLRELEATQHAHAQHVKILEGDRDAWRARLGRRRPQAEEEAVALRAQLEAAQGELRALAEEKERTQAELVGRSSSLEAKIKSLATICQRHKHAADELKKQLEQREPPEALRADLAQCQAALAEREEKLARYAEAIKRMGGLQSACARLEAEKAAAIAAGEKRAEELQREHQMHKTVLASQWQARLNKLQAQLDGVTGTAGVLVTAMEAVDVPAAGMKRADRMDLDDAEEGHEVKRAKPEAEASDEDDVMMGAEEGEEEEEEVPASQADAMMEAEGVTDIEELSDYHEEDREDGQGEETMVVVEEPQRQPQQPEEEEEAEEEEAEEEAAQAEEVGPAAVDDDWDLLNDLLEEDKILHKEEEEEEEEEEEAEKAPTAAPTLPTAVLATEPSAPAAPAVSPTLSRTINLASRPATISTPSTTATATGPSRVISLSGVTAPTLSVSVGTSTATPAPPAATQPLRRIIDLSQTGRKPIEPPQPPAGAAAQPQSQAQQSQPQPQQQQQQQARKIAFAGGNRGGKKKFRRGGGHGGGGAN